MKASDLPQPIVAAKSNFLPASGRLSFTPSGKGANSKAKLESLVNRQSDGYVLEYITQTMETPNAGFENDPKYLKDKKIHQELEGRLVAIHKIQHSSHHLSELIGNEEFQKVQDMWARKKNLGFRWSVSFPIIESYEIIGKPTAKEVLGEEAAWRIFRRQERALRKLNDDDRVAIGGLEIRQLEARNEWIALERDFEIAEKSEVFPEVVPPLDEDLMSALEGMDEEKKSKYRKRAAWLATKFIHDRTKSNNLRCDDCGFDPLCKVNGTRISPRSLLDVHHKNPLYEGKRLTTTADFALLCPTCHRFEHARLRTSND